VKIVLQARLVSYALFVGHVYWGAGYLLGPPRIYSSGSYRVVMSWLTAHTWGWLFVACAIGCLLTPTVPRALSAAVHGFAAAVLLTFAAGLGAAQVVGTSQGWGGPVLFLGPAVFHVLIVRARYQRPKVVRP